MMSALPAEAPHSAPTERGPDSSAVGATGASGACSVTVAAAAGLPPMRLAMPLALASWRELLGAIVAAKSSSMASCCGDPGTGTSWLRGPSLAAVPGAKTTLQQTGGVRGRHYTLLLTSVPLCSWRNDSPNRWLPPACDAAACSCSRLNQASSPPVHT